MSDNAFDFASSVSNDEELKLALIAAFGTDAIDWLEECSEGLPTEIDSSTPHASASTVSEAEMQLDYALKQISNALQDREGEQFSTLDGNDKRTRSKNDNAICYVVFEVGGQRFGIPLTGVQEIDRCGKVTILPRTPDWLRGITNLRGKVFSVTDFRRLLKLGHESPAVGEKIIVVQSKRWNARTALVVDRVIGLRNLETNAESSTVLTGPLATFACGISSTQDESIVLIQPDLLLGCNDLQTFANC